MTSRARTLRWASLICGLLVVGATVRAVVPARAAARSDSLRKGSTPRPEALQRSPEVAESADPQPQGKGAERAEPTSPPPEVASDPIRLRDWLESLPLPALARIVGTKELDGFVVAVVRSLPGPSRSRDEFLGRLNQRIVAAQETRPRSVR